MRQTFTACPKLMNLLQKCGSTRVDYAMPFAVLYL